MSHTAVQRFYRYHAYVYDWTRWAILHGRRRAISRLNLRPDSRVLEIGCGTGLNFHYVLEHLDPHRGRLTGLDFSEDMLRRAERRVAAAGWPNVELIQGDATKLSLGGKYDAVCFGYSLTMIPDWREALRRAHEHVAPGGRLMLLDFGPFRSWGPLAPLMRAWLRANHVETLEPYVDEMVRICPSTKIEYRVGGYYFVAMGTKE
ncbi:Demethylmenaquinone methyltransferase [Phycisphaerae bacterium RAS1]|nr:Demethylmenaquinone methyltransferase [Phycisphaerae bacterium RAS1]